MAENDGREVKNKAEALANKLEFEMRHGFRSNNHYEFQGGFLKYHQWITLPIGALLFLVGMLFQQGAWIYFYLIGLFKISRDTLREIFDNTNSKSDLKPMKYYLIGALLIAILMYQAGYTIPDMHLGLVYNTNEVLP